MKFQPDRMEGVNVISGHGPGSVSVNGIAWQDNLIVPWAGDVHAWAGARIGQLAPEHFEQLVALRPELVIFGSGPSLRFAAPALVRSLIDARIGVESMDTPAACRTYNILAGEGRRVVAALLMA